MKQTIQYINKDFTFDAAHRIVNHVGGCGNIHGHLYFGTLRFSFKSEEMEDPGLGYAIDFSEIKRIGLAFINDHFDHAYIANPKDYMVDVLKEHNSKHWTMGLNGDEFNNPSVENMAKEIFMIMNILFQHRGITIDKVILYETPTSHTECFEGSITLNEMEKFHFKYEEYIKLYAEGKGVKYYDITK